MYLNNHTYYSLRYGTLSPQELVEQAVAYGLTRVVLTDINNTSALFEFHKACREGGVTPIAGIEFRQDDQTRYIGSARNEDGLRELTTLLTRHLTEGHTIPRMEARRSDLHRPPQTDRIISIPRILRNTPPGRERAVFVPPPPSCGPAGGSGTRDFSPGRRPPHSQTAPLHR